MMIVHRVWFAQRRQGWERRFAIAIVATLWLALLTAMPSAAGATVSGTIDVGAGPYGVVVTRDGTTAYVANSGDGTVSVLDVATSSVKTTWAIGGTPAGLVLSADAQRLYVARLPESQVLVIDTTDGSVVSEVAVPGGPMKLALSPDGSRVFASLPVQNRVAVIDTATDTVIGAFKVGMLPYGLMPSHDGAALYVSDMMGVKVLNAVTGALLKAIPVGAFPVNFALTSDGATLYVTNYASSTVSVIDTSTNTVTTTFPVPGGPWAVALSPDEGSLFATARDADQLVQVDVATTAVASTPAVGSEPFDVAVTPDGTRAFVVNAKSDDVSVVGLRPTPPRRVQIVPGDTELHVSWQEPQYTAGAPIQTYTATAQPGGKTCSTTSTHCTIADLANGTAYTITVIAQNTVGISDPSAPSDPATPLPKPGPPTQVVGAPGDAHVVVSWREPAANGGPAVTSYKATASPDGASCTTAGATVCTVTGLANGTAYTFTVVATNGIGEGPRSDPSAPVVPVGRPQPPTAVVARATRRSAIISWTAPKVTGGMPLTGYTATVQPGGQTCATAQTQCTIPDLLPATRYTATVVAGNPVGVSDPSPGVAFTTSPLLKVQRPVDAAGRPPQRVALSGVTVLTGPNAVTNAGKRIRTVVRVTPKGVTAQGEVRYYTIIRGKAGKVSIRTFGYPRLKVVLVQRAPATGQYRPYLRRTVYLGGVRR